MVNLIVLIVILIIFSLAIAKIVRDKKNGVKCSGCPQSKTCGSNCSHDS